MNPHTKYRVIFNGEIIEGFSVAQVKASMASLFSMERKRLEEMLFKNFPATVNDDLDYESAMEYKTELEKIGATVVLEEMENLRTEPQPSPQERASKKTHPHLPEEWARILDAFSGKINPVPITSTYHFGLLFVSMIMIVLPIVYVLFILLTGYYTYVHATENFTLFGSVTLRAKLLFYFTPLVAGITMVVFMIKPLFAPAYVDHSPVSLHPKKEQLLFLFVQRICSQVGAPFPSRIDVNNQVNASASFRKGLFSFMENDLVLTIGVPLAAGLSLRQFAGVLAHEFGHFSQGAGMRLSHIIRSVNFWFMRVVYERDEFDVKLIQWSENSETAYLKIPVVVARFCVWLSRRFLWLLMKIGQFFSSYLSREMEFDADRYEARVAGSTTFESTAYQLHLLVEATETAHRSIEKSLSTGRLPDNYAGFIVDHLQKMPAPVVSKVKSRTLMGQTGLFDTHPTDRERIKNAKFENAKGVFSLEEPATILFSDFQLLSQQLTLKMYREELGTPITKEQLVPISDFAGNTSAD